MYTPEEMEIIHQEVMRLSREGKDTDQPSVRTPQQATEKGELRFAILFFGTIITISLIATYFLVSFPIETVVKAIVYTSIALFIPACLIFAFFVKRLNRVFANYVFTALTCWMISIMIGALFLSILPDLLQH